MNELIIMTDGIAILNPETAQQIAEFEKNIKEIKDAEESLRASILEEMEKKGIKKLDTPDLSITYKASYDKENFQTRDFKADHPDLFDSYVKISPCKASVVIKLKEEKKDA
jgi:hypothetical protein